MTYDQSLVDTLTKVCNNEGFFIIWGSRLYGCHRKESDHDFQLIVPDNVVAEIKSNISHGWNARCGDVHLHSETEYLQSLADFKPWAIETHMAPNLYRTIGKTELKTVTPLDKKKLRDEFARTASNSYVKCKKKLIIDNDFNPLIAKKSMFHSLRLLDYAWQIAHTGHIRDWGSMNNHLRNLIALPNDWKAIEAEYKPIYNQLASALREACPKN
jgi:hypothetical protein